MLISVIIPAYNDAEFIGESIRSGLTQTHEDLELIVVDDGSTDSTVARARQAFEGDPRATVLSFRNGGPAVARNRGLARATGEFVAWLDADDLWAPGKLAIQLAVFDSEYDCVCVGCLLRYIARDGTPLPRFLSRSISTGEDPREPGQQALIQRALVFPFPPSAMLLRTEAVRAVGGADETFERRAGDDVDLLARVARLGRVSIAPEPLAYYRLREDSHTGSDWVRSRYEGWFVALRQRARLAGGDLTWPEYTATHPLSRHDRRMSLASLNYRRAGVSMLNRRYLTVLRQLATAVIFDPSYVLARVRRNLRGKGLPSSAFQEALAPDGRGWLEDPAGRA